MSARCASCSAEAGSGPRCERCGADLVVSDLPTGTAPRSASPAGEGARPASRGGAGRTSSAVRTGRFVPGTVLAERYRIVGLLGRGGMGEVYRADDLKLDQAVALKFLPEALEEDAERRERFFGEVRLARQVAHPSVCRVYDVVESAGTPFLSMEYVDGEDLASLLRRIGRLPRDKALEIGRQLCAGLAAAHANGVLHRDLKPENVMIDGRGRARITDFGLAMAAGEAPGPDVRSGTPTYMSPEQLAGREVTVRSDVYALGLVLYELFTGRRAFEAATLGELERRHREEPPLPPSELVPDLDPAVERAILRCLEKEPQRRPSSALSVAAALPGGDPLAAALAAGETPSPELVAAAGEGLGLQPRAAWALLAAVAAALPLGAWLWGPLELSRMTPFDKPPAVLEDRARELLRRLVPARAEADADSGFAVDADYIKRVRDTDRSPRRWDTLASGEPPVVHFWHRQSPRALQSHDLLGRVYWANPPPLDSGMTGVRLDMRGRLVQFYAVPAQLEPEGRAAAAEVDWKPLFAEAGLDPARFQPVEPRWLPPFHAEQRRAWQGTSAARPDLSLRVEAAAHRGEPVFFHVLPPWARPERMVPFEFTRQQRAGQALAVLMLVSVVALAALLARGHLARGRGDRAGALRLAKYMVAVAGAGWLLHADHVADFRGEMMLAVRGLGSVLLMGLVIWTLYLALEPYVRRRWPEAIISWTRLLAGRIRDPLVGRDVLIGCAGGTLMAVAVALVQRLPAWIGRPASAPVWSELDTLLGPRDVLAQLLFGQPNAAGGALGFLLLLLLARLVLRNVWLGGAAVLVVLSLPDALTSDLPFWATLVLDVLLNGILAFVLVRFGLLAGMVNVYVANRLIVFPLAAGLTSWTAGPTLWLWALVLGLAVFGFRAALAGRPAFPAAPVH